jgi:hypothetical protein
VTPGTNEVRVGWYIVGIYPSSNSNGVFFVVLEGQEFLTYCAIGSHLAHAFWSLAQTSLRYCSRDWFVCSLWLSVCG